MDFAAFRDEITKYDTFRYMGKIEKIVGHVRYFRLHSGILVYRLSVKHSASGVCLVNAGYGSEKRGLTCAV